MTDTNPNQTQTKLKQMKTKRQILTQKFITAEEHLRLRQTMRVTGYKWDGDSGLYKKGRTEKELKDYAPLDPDAAKYLLPSLDHGVAGIKQELQQSLEGESYFNAHYVLNQVQDVRRALDSIEAAAKDHQANGHC